jgi:hypothetical protein
LIGLKIDGKARKIFFSKKHKNKNWFFHSGRFFSCFHHCCCLKVFFCENWGKFNLNTRFEDELNFEWSQGLETLEIKIFATQKSLKFSAAIKNHKHEPQKKKSQSKSNSDKINRLMGN